MTAKELKAKLPTMWNAVWSYGTVMLFCILALLFQAFTSVDYGEAEWGLILLAAREGFAIANKIVDYYTNGNGKRGD